MSNAEANPSDGGDFQIRLTAIERRLGRIERHLRLNETTEDVEAPRAEAEAPEEPIDVLPPSLPVAPPPIPVVATTDVLEELMRRRNEARDNGGAIASDWEIPHPSPLPDYRGRESKGASASPPHVEEGSPPLAVDALSPEPVLAYEARPGPIAPAKQSRLEQVIGLKLAGWVGAIVLVIGAGLGIKYLYDIHFFAGVSPVVWLTLLWLAGFVLIGAGEFVYRRINAISATGLYGAGVATLFLVSYAGHGYYGLYEQTTAFVLMAISALVGAGVAMRGRLVSIAVISLLGGLLAPLVLHGESSLVVPFLLYLLALQLVALFLAGWGNTRRWWTLRGLSLAGTSIWVATLIYPQAHPWGAAMWFVLVSALLYQLELIISAKRSSDEAPGESTAGVVFSVIVTGALTAGILWIFHLASPAARGLWVASFAAVALLAGLALPKLLPDRSRARALAYGYRVQAAVLLLLAIPVTFTGAAISIGWALAALALSAVGSRLNDRAARITGSIAWGLAIANLSLWAQNPHHLEQSHRVWLTLLGQPILAWMGIGWGIALVGHAMAWCFSRCEGAGESERFAPATMSALATAVVVVVSVLALPPLGATGVLLVYAWLLVASDFVVPGLAPLAQATAVLALCAGKWAIVDTLVARLAPGWKVSASMPVFNPQMLLGVAIAGSIIAMYRLRRDSIRRILARVSHDRANPAILVLALVTLLITFGLMMEIDRTVSAQRASIWPKSQLLQMSWTMLWTAAGVVYLFLFAHLDPSSRARQAWRRGAWMLAGAIAIKFVLVDTVLCGILGHGVRGAMPLLNFQTLAAVVVVAGLVGVHLILRSGVERSTGDETGIRVGLAALAVLLWAGTLEIDRLAAGGMLPGLGVWHGQLRQLAWTAWWTAGLCGFLVVVCLRDRTALARMPILHDLAGAMVLIAMKYIVLDTLAFRIHHAPMPARIGVNLQTFCGAAVFAAMLLIRHFSSLSEALQDSMEKSRRRANPSTLRFLSRAAGAAAVILPLWIGSLEIDRALALSTSVSAAFTNPRLAELVALSIFWSVYAIGCIVAGFAWRIAGLRYFGLALFALTLLKVGLLDLRQAQTGYRILSFIALGGLLLGTSVVYGKLTPKLLQEGTRV